MKRWLLSGLVLVTLCCHSVLAMADIAGATKINVGDRIDLTIDGDWDLIFWVVPEQIDFETFDGSKRLLGWTGANGITVTFTANVVKLDWENKSVLDQKTLRHQIEIVKPDAPTPDPDEPDEPDVPLTGLALKVYTWSTGVVDPWRSKSSALSDNYQSIASKLVSIELTIAQALDELRERNNEVLDTRESKDAWAVFGSRLQETMQNAWPMDREEFVVFLQDVAKGLSYVK